MTSWGTGGVLLMERFGVRDLKRLRSACLKSVLKAGLDKGRAMAFVFAINEGLTNAVLHGGTMGHLTLLRSDTGRLIANVTDRGRGPAGIHSEDLMPPISGGARGLWAAMRMVDDMTLTTGVDGTTLKLEVAISHPSNISWTETGGYAELVPLLSSILFDEASHSAGRPEPAAESLALVNDERRAVGRR
jgi:serine/threonine-protein kinase RsbW